MSKARHDQFLPGELRRLVHDEHGWVLEEASQQPPHLMLSRYACSDHTACSAASAATVSFAVVLNTTRVRSRPAGPGGQRRVPCLLLKWRQATHEEDTSQATRNEDSLPSCICASLTDADTAGMSCWTSRSSPSLQAIRPPGEHGA